MSKTLSQMHNEISPNHYDIGIRKNIFQKFWHKKRFNEVFKMVVPAKGRVLDVGCHGGLFTEKILKWTNAEEVYGVDISEKAIQHIKKRIPSGVFNVGNAEKLSFKSNYFNAVFCLEMIEHVDHPEEVLKEIYRVLKKEGYALILAPTDNFLFRIIWFIWNLHYPVWKHVHVQSFQSDLLERMVLDTGFQVDRVKVFNLGMLKLVRVIKKNG